MLDDIINVTYDSTKGSPGTYSEAWDNIIKHSKAVPSENDKPADGDENSKDNNQFADKSKHGESTLEEHALDMT